MPARSSPALAWTALRKHRVATASLVVFVVVTVACLAAPLLAPYPIDAVDLSSLRHPPSRAH